MKERDLRRYRRRIRLARAVLGGRCQWPGCDSRRRLEFDHVDPSTKVGSPHVLWSSPAALGAEIHKLQLLCHAHHKLKTENDRVARATKPTRQLLEELAESECPW